MEKSLQKTETSLQCSDKIIEVGKIIYQINLLTSYPLNDFQINDWAKCICRLLPEIDLIELQNVIDKMITGEIEYKTSGGIQNIFKAINPINQKSSVTYPSRKNG